MRRKIAINAGARNEPTIKAPKYVKQTKAAKPGKGLNKVLARLMSADEIRAGAVLDLSLIVDDKSPLENSLMGPSEMGQKCATCNNIIRDCTGHFAQMSLPEDSYFANPIFVKDGAKTGLLPSLMNLFCYSAFKDADRSQGRQVSARFKFSEIEIEELKITLYNLHGVQRLKKLAKLAKTKSCGLPHNECPKIRANTKTVLEAVIGDTNIDVIEIPVLKLYLEAIKKFVMDNGYTEFIGFDNIETLPSVIIETIYVTPPCVRLSTILNGKKQLSAFTLIYEKMLNIIRTINNPKTPKASIESENDKLRSAFLQYVTGHSEGVTSGKTSNDMQTLQSFLDKKDGAFQSKGLTKTQDNAGRTVIVGDNDIDPDEVGIPEWMAKEFSIKLEVTEQNAAYINEYMIPADEIKTLIKNPGTNKSQIFRITSQGQIHKAVPGDVVYRTLLNGDAVIINRQPTLHRWSVIVCRAVILPQGFNTVKLNEAYVTGLNADFDGDEVHIHIPSSLKARAQALYFMGVDKCVVSDQKSSNIFGLIQNSIWVGYRMTKDNVKFSAEEWNRLATYAKYGQNEFDVNERIKYVLKTAPRVFRKYRKSYNLYNAYTLLSIALPTDFSWKFKVSSGEDMCIENGIMYQGSFDKSAVGTSPNSIVQSIFNSHGPKATMIFVGVYQKLITAYMEHTAFTITISDFVPSDDLEEELSKIKSDAYREAKSIGQLNVPGVFNKEALLVLLREILTNTVQSAVFNEIAFHVFEFMELEIVLFRNGEIEQPFRETKVRYALEKALTISKLDNKDQLLEILYDPVIEFLREEMSDPLSWEKIQPKSQFNQARVEVGIMDVFAETTNKGTAVIKKKQLQLARRGVISNLGDMVDSRARGQEFNRIQSMFALGQQTMKGARLKGVLPFYSNGFDGFISDPYAYGYISSPYYQGLSPGEYASASEPTRESMTNTSINTAVTGYMGGRLQASAGDYKIAEDGTVRNIRGQIVSWTYGTHGLDASRMVQFQDTFIPFDPVQLADEIDSSSEVIETEKKHFRRL